MAQAAPGQEGQQEAAPQQQEQQEEQTEPQDTEALAAVRNRGKGQYGCPHYRRRVKFITPCCNEEWWCRHCHNKAHDTDEQDWQKKHELDRKAIQELVCALCDTRQPVSTNCVACGVDFGAYSCLICRFFDDDLEKKPYHCGQCGICRIGGRENYFHCDTCGSCYSMALQGNHQCVERAMHQNCPICFEFLFESVDPTTVLRCGHTIHTQCVRELEANPNAVCPTCPICKKSLGDYSAHWREIDHQVALLPVPPEYRGWRADILCNDCSRSSNVAFHLLGLKCGSCGSYNTRRMGLHTSDGSPLEHAARLGVPPQELGGAGGRGAGAGLAPNFVESLLAAMWPPRGRAGDGGAAGQGEEGEDDDDDDEEEEEEEEEDHESWVSGQDEEEYFTDEWETDDGEDDDEEGEGEEGEEQQAAAAAAGEVAPAGAAAEAAAGAPEAAGAAAPGEQQQQQSGSAAVQGAASDGMVDGGGSGAADPHS